MPLRSTRKGRKSRRRLRSRKVRRHQRGGAIDEIKSWLDQLILLEPYDLKKSYNDYFFDATAFAAASGAQDPTQPARQIAMIPMQAFDETVDYEEDFLGTPQSLKTIAANLQQQCQLGEDGAKSLGEFLAKIKNDSMFQAYTLPALNQLETKLREILVTNQPVPSVEHLNKYQKPPTGTLDIQNETEQPALVWAVLLAARPIDVAPVLFSEEAP